MKLFRKMLGKKEKTEEVPSTETVVPSTSVEQAPVQSSRARGNAVSSISVPTAKVPWRDLKSCLRLQSLCGAYLDTSNIHEKEKVLMSLAPVLRRVTFGETDGHPEMISKLEELLQDPFQFCLDISAYVVNDLRNGLKRGGPSIAGDYLLDSTMKGPSIHRMLVESMSILANCPYPAKGACAAGLPGVLAALFVSLAFKFPRNLLDRSDDSRGDNGYNYRLVEDCICACLLSFLKHPLALQQLTDSSFADGGALSALFRIITSAECRPATHSNALNLLHKVVESFISGDVVAYLTREGCVYGQLRFFETSSSRSVFDTKRKVYAVRVMIEVLCKSCQSSGMLLQAFGSAGGYSALKNFLLSLRDSELENHVVDSLLILCYHGSVKSGNLPHEASGEKFVQNVESFEILADAFVESHSDSQRELIIHRILQVYAATRGDKNYLIVENVHAPLRFLKILDQLSDPIQILVMKLLEYILAVVDRLPCQELSQIFLFIRQGSSKISTQYNIFQSLTKWITYQESYREAFIQLGLLEGLINVLQREANNYLSNNPLGSSLTVSTSSVSNIKLDSSECTSSIDSLSLSLDLVRILLKDHRANVVLFRELQGIDALSACIALSENIQRHHRRLALEVYGIMIQVDSEGSEDYIATLIKTLVSRPSATAAAKRDILECFEYVLTRSVAAKNAFRDLGGFVCVVSLLENLRGAFGKGPDVSSPLGRRLSRDIILHAFFHGGNLSRRNSSVSASSGSQGGIIQAKTVDFDSNSVNFEELWKLVQSIILVVAAAVTDSAENRKYLCCDLKYDMLIVSLIDTGVFGYRMAANKLLDLLIAIAIEKRCYYDVGDNAVSMEHSLKTIDFVGGRVLADDNNASSELPSDISKIRPSSLSQIGHARSSTFSQPVDDEHEVHPNDVLYDSPAKESPTALNVPVDEFYNVTPFVPRIVRNAGLLTEAVRRLIPMYLNDSQRLSLLSKISSLGNYCRRNVVVFVESGMISAVLSLFNHKELLIKDHKVTNMVFGLLKILGRASLSAVETQQLMKLLVNKSGAHVSGLLSVLCEISCYEHTCDYWEMDLRNSGHAAVKLPVLLDRIWPPANFTYSVWFRVVTLPTFNINQSLSNNRNNSSNNNSNYTSNITDYQIESNISLFHFDSDIPDNDLSLSITTSLKIGLHVPGMPNNEIVEYNCNIIPGRWYHLALTTRGGGRRSDAESSLYLNGAIVDSKIIRYSSVKSTVMGHFGTVAHRAHCQQIVWHMGPVCFLEECLADTSIASLFFSDMSYYGSFLGSHTSPFYNDDDAVAIYRRQIVQKYYSSLSSIDCIPISNHSNDYVLFSFHPAVAEGVISGYRQDTSSYAKNHGSKLTILPPNLKQNYNNNNSTTITTTTTTTTTTTSTTTTTTSTPPPPPPTPTPTSTSTTTNNNATMPNISSKPKLVSNNPSTSVSLSDPVFVAAQLIPFVTNPLTVVRNLSETRYGQKEGLYGCSEGDIFKIFCETFCTSIRKIGGIPTCLLLFENIKNIYDLSLCIRLLSFVLYCNLENIYIMNDIEGFKVLSGLLRRHLPVLLFNLNETFEYESDLNDDNALSLLLIEIFNLVGNNIIINVVAFHFLILDYELWGMTNVKTQQQLFEWLNSLVDPTLNIPSVVKYNISCLNNMDILRWLLVTAMDASFPIELYDVLFRVCNTIFQGITDTRTLDEHLQAVFTCLVGSVSGIISNVTGSFVGNVVSAPHPLHSPSQSLSKSPSSVSSSQYISVKANYLRQTLMKILNAIVARIDFVINFNNNFAATNSSGVTHALTKVIDFKTLFLFLHKRCHKHTLIIATKTLVNFIQSYKLYGNLFRDVNNVGSSIFTGIREPIINNGNVRCNYISLLYLFLGVAIPKSTDADIFDFISLAREFPDVSKYTIPFPEILPLLFNMLEQTVVDTSGGLENIDHENDVVDHVFGGSSFNMESVFSADDVLIMLYFFIHLFENNEKFRDVACESNTLIRLIKLLHISEKCAVRTGRVLTPAVLGANSLTEKSSQDQQLQQQRALSPVPGSHPPSSPSPSPPPATSVSPSSVSIAWPSDLFYTVPATVTYHLLCLCLKRLLKSSIEFYISDILHSYPMGRDQHSIDILRINFEKNIISYVIQMINTDILPIICQHRVLSVAILKFIKFVIDLIVNNSSNVMNVLQLNYVQILNMLLDLLKHVCQDTTFDRDVREKESNRARTASNMRSIPNSGITGAFGLTVSAAGDIRAEYDELLRDSVQKFVNIALDAVSLKISSISSDENSNVIALLCLIVDNIDIIFPPKRKNDVDLLVLFLCFCYRFCLSDQINISQKGVEMFKAVMNVRKEDIKSLTESVKVLISVTTPINGSENNGVFIDSNSVASVDYLVDIYNDGFSTLLYRVVNPNEFLSFLSKQSRACDSLFKQNKILLSYYASKRSGNEEYLKSLDESLRFHQKRCKLLFDNESTIIETVTKDYAPVNRRVRSQYDDIITYYSMDYGERNIISGEWWEVIKQNLHGEKNIINESRQSWVWALDATIGPFRMRRKLFHKFLYDIEEDDKSKTVDDNVDEDTSEKNSDESSSVKIRSSESSEISSDILGRHERSTSLPTPETRSFSFSRPLKNSKSFTGKIGSVLTSGIGSMLSHSLKSTLESVRNGDVMHTQLMKSISSIAGKVGINKNRITSIIRSSDNEGDTRDDADDISTHKSDTGSDYSKRPLESVGSDSAITSIDNDLSDDDVDTEEITTTVGNDSDDDDDGDDDDDDDDDVANNDTDSADDSDGNEFEDNRNAKRSLTPVHVILPSEHPSSDILSAFKKSSSGPGRKKSVQFSSNPNADDMPFTSNNSSDSKDVNSVAPSNKNSAKAKAQVKRSSSFNYRSVSMKSRIQRALGEVKHHHRNSRNREKEKEFSYYKCVRVAGLDEIPSLFVIGTKVLAVFDNLTEEGGAIVQWQGQSTCNTFTNSSKDTVQSTLNATVFGPLQYRKWFFHEIRDIQKCRYLLRDVGIEIFGTRNVDSLLVFDNDTRRNIKGARVRDQIYKYIIKLEVPHVVRTVSGVGVPSAASPEKRNIATGAAALFARKLASVSPDSLSRYQRRWMDGEISNFQYLMHLNDLAGRSFNDLNAYPVFPWILSDYESPFLDLSSPSIYRDLSKPMGALMEPRASKFRERFECWDDPDGVTPPFHYGAHYSSAGTVLHYFIRLEPFTSFAKQLQGGSFDHPDRLFLDLGLSYRSSAGFSGNLSDVRELTPEFFYLPEFLVNINNEDFGTTQRGLVVGDVALPPWANGSAREFIRLHRMALESEYVSSHLHEWVDLIFGYKQQGEEAERAANVFYYLTYEGAVDIDKIEQPDLRAAIVSQISNFGQTPRQIFDKPHPRRKANIQRNNNLLLYPDKLMSTKLTKVGINTMFQIGQLAVSPKTGSPVSVEHGCIMVPPKHKLSFKYLLNDCSLRLLVIDKVNDKDKEKISDDSFSLVNHHQIFEKLHYGQITSCAVCEDGTLLLTGGADALVKVWKFEKTKVGNSTNVLHRLIWKKNFCGHNGAVIVLVVSISHGIAISGDIEGRICVWDINTLFFRMSFPTVAYKPVAIVIHQDNGNVVISTLFNIFVYSINGDLLFSVDITPIDHGCAVSCLCVATGHDWLDDDLYITGHVDGSIKFWGTQSTNSIAMASPGSIALSSSIITKRGASYLPLSSALHLYASYRSSHGSVAITAFCFIPDKDTNSASGGCLWIGDAAGNIDQWSLPTDENSGEKAHWVQNSAQKCCYRCQRNFSLMERRHHCRSCGNLVCASCSLKRTAVPTLNFFSPVRVCDYCYSNLEGIPGTPTV